MKGAFTSDLSGANLCLRCDWRKLSLPIIDDILDTLKNGHWHDIEEISERTQLTKLKVELVTNFLSEYNFVEIDKKEHKTRLTPPLLSFIKKIQTIETKEEY